MNSIELLSTFFGWCVVINFALLIVSAAILLLMREPLAKMHAKMFGLSETEVTRTYFQFLAHYKIITIVFTLVPYLALRIIA